MHLLVVTNIYPPQELGGYGRCISDFVWGLKQHGHHVQVLSADAPYLHVSTDYGPSGEPVSRSLRLKGSYDSGFTLFTDKLFCESLDNHNNRELSSWLSKNCFDGIILGNLDLLGIEIFSSILSFDIKVLHHVGFTYPPFPTGFYPNSSNYSLVSASESVRCYLKEARYPVHSSPVIYPGVRTDLFNSSLGEVSSSLKVAAVRIKSGFPLGHPSNPLKLGYAGLIMGSKGLHTLLDSIFELYSKGYSIQANFAGSVFQTSYSKQLQSRLAQSKLSHQVNFVGNLTRAQLVRFWSLHHIGVFPSIDPEAFGISGAEIMASGLALVSSGVGGASEIFEDQVSGFKFQANDPSSLSGVIIKIISSPSVLYSAAYNGRKRVNDQFSVINSAKKLESLFNS